MIKDLAAVITTPDRNRLPRYLFSSMPFFPWDEASIEVWVGIKGSGKSYFQTLIVLVWLAMGYPVITNIRLKRMPPPEEGCELGKYYELDSYTDFVPYCPECEELRKGLKLRGAEVAGVFKCPHDKEGHMLPFLALVAKVREESGDAPILTVIDEGAQIFGRKSYRNMPPVMEAFLRQQRKLKTFVVISSQNLGGISTDFRELCTMFRFHRNLVAFPPFDKWLGVFTPNFHRQVARPNAEGKPDRKIQTGAKYFRIRKTVCSYFDTAQVHRFPAAASFKPPRFGWARVGYIAMFFAVLVTGLVGIGALGKFLFFQFSPGHVMDGYVELWHATRQPAGAKKSGGASSAGAVGGKTPGDLAPREPEVQTPIRVLGVEDYFYGSERVVIHYELGGIPAYLETTLGTPAHIEARSSLGEWIALERLTTPTVYRTWK